MLETKCVRDNFEMLVTVLAVFVPNVLYLSTLAFGTNIRKMPPISKFRHQDPKIVINIYVAGNFLRHYNVIIFRHYFKIFGMRYIQISQDICDENFAQECFFLANVSLKFQRATFDDFEIVYYQWEGFLSSEGLMEASELCLNLYRLVHKV